MVTTMASVKLVNGHGLHHTSHYYPHHHYPLLRPTSPPEQTMTLDYSLPHRSRSMDNDPGSDSARDLSSPQSVEESEAKDPQSETPTKKNKRKLSEPKKRADIVVKKPRSSSPNLDVETVDVGAESHKDNDSIEEKTYKGKKLVNGHCKRSSSSSQSSSVSKSTAQVSSKGNKRDTPSSSSSLSNNDTDANKDSSLPSVQNGIPPHFLHPMFTGVHPSALGYVPGLYFGGRPFPHPGIHASFPAIPLHLQHSYLAAAAAAVAAAQSSSPSSVAATATSSSLPTTSLSATSGSNAETSVSDSFRSHQPTSHPVINPPVLPSSSSRLSSSSSLPPPRPSSSNLQPSSSHHRPGSSRTNTSINDDDDDASSSRAQSPEDLSLGGKMSRKHRKNYKNMTRERRVEANARERTRVHTISAAFDALRRAVPSYSHNQKLSKLAILRIACSYIMSLARLADKDYTSASEHIGRPLTFAECVDMCTNTIQTEGRARRRH